MVAAEAAEATVVTEAQTDLAPVVTDENVDTGHKVIFYVIIGALCITGIGIPFAIIKYRKMKKKLDQYEQKFGPLPETEEAADAAADDASKEATPEAK